MAKVALWVSGFWLVVLASFYVLPRGSSVWWVAFDLLPFAFLITTLVAMAWLVMTILSRRKLRAPGGHLAPMSRFTRGALTAGLIWIVCIAVAVIVPSGSIAWNITATVASFGFLVAPPLLIVTSAYLVRLRRHAT